EALHNLRIGDYIGVRGPLGNHFTLPKDDSQNIFLIGGGIGMAPLKFLASELKKSNRKFSVIEGAKIEGDLIYVDEFHNLCEGESEVFFCTDDGSYGLEGFASDNFEKKIKDQPKEELKNIIAYTCGPEIMMYKVFQICEKNNIELQASLERIMRCGCGLCGLCVMDPLGLLVCKDGP
ncbi:MAG: dihydroorotate dehydrogenase electron transfer subunit, partial [Candidatus Lokiarchaeota archaeon]|nr:dihydroorotate dehydrogenase electron transfer subunit [Candidatus Lokiarchaeota archaeon]